CCSRCTIRCARRRTRRSNWRRAAAAGARPSNPTRATTGTCNSALPTAPGACAGACRAGNARRTCIPRWMHRSRRRRTPGDAMDAVLNAAGTAHAVSGDGCHHCGEALPATPARVRLDGEWRAFCCDGCAAAAQWIRDARLDDYYRLRSEPGMRVRAEAADFGVWDREELLAGHARDIEGGREITVLSDGMRCAACAWLIDRALAREDGVLDAGANAVT